MQEQQSKQELVYIGNIGGYQTDFPEIFNNKVVCSVNMAATTSKR